NAPGPVNEKIRTTLPPSHDVTVPAPATTGLPTKTIFGIVGVVTLVGIVMFIIAVSSSKGPSVEKKLDNAIAAGQIFSPATDSARDLYFQLKNSGASEVTLRPYRDKLLPLLTDNKLQLIRNFM